MDRRMGGSVEELGGRPDASSMSDAHVFRPMGAQRAHAIIGHEHQQRPCSIHESVDSDCNKKQAYVPAMCGMIAVFLVYIVARW